MINAGREWPAASRNSSSALLAIPISNCSRMSDKLYSAWPSSRASITRLFSPVPGTPFENASRRRKRCVNSAFINPAFSCATTLGMSKSCLSSATATCVLMSTPNRPGPTCTLAASAGRSHDRRAQAISAYSRASVPSAPNAIIRSRRRGKLTELVHLQADRHSHAPQARESMYFLTDVQPVHQLKLF